MLMMVIRGNENVKCAMNVMSPAFIMTQMVNQRIDSALKVKTFTSALFHDSVLLGS